MIERLIYRIIHLMAIVLASAPIAFSSGAHKDSSGAHKERTVSLALLGYEKPEQSQFLRRVRAAFLDNHEIAVSFPVPNPTMGLTTRSERRGGAYLFKTAFIDAETGAARGERTWTTFKGQQGIIPVNSREFLVMDADHLYLYSLDLRLKATKELQAAGFVLVKVSLSGKLIYIMWAKEVRTEVEVLDAESLRTLGEFDIPDIHSWYAAANDDGLMYRADLRKQTLLLQSYRQASKFFMFDPPLTCASAPVFITETLFTVSTGCRSLDLLESSGRVVQSISFGKKSIGLVLPAPEARRFCVDVNKLTGGSNVFDISAHITEASLICFDSVTLRQLWTVPLPPKHHKALSLTISPDASKAAFIEGEAVKIIDLPEDSSLARWKQR